MNAEHVSVDYGPKGKVIECLIKVLPAVGVAVFLVYLIQEAVHHGHVSAFVIPPQQKYSIGILDFQAEQ